MGGHTSYPSPPSPPPPLLYEPCRQINWRNNKESLKDVNSFKTFNKDQQLRILVYGQSGAGKSSFINSVQSALRGRICRPALTANTSGDCFTKKCKTYKIQRERPDDFYPFVFTDIMGLNENKGVLVDDVKLCLQGRIKEGYEFNPESKLSEGDEYYNDAPTGNEEVQVLVYVVAADTFPVMSDEVKRKIKDIREAACHLDIPQIVILTKVDAACPEVERYLQNVYRSKKLKQLMQRFSSDVGIPMDSIFLVKNYHEETNLNDNIDSLILNVLTHIINSAEDFVNMKNQTM